MWNIAHNLGGFAAPILAGTAARTLGWSVSFVSFRDASILQLKCVFLEKWELVGSGNHRPLCRVTDHVDIERLA